MHDVRTANLLGAAALAISDLVLAEATRTAGTSASGAAALVVLSVFPEISVTALGRRVGLSQSAAARMVDALQAAGLVDRRQGVGREVAVALTGRGARAADELLSARAVALTEALDALTHAERDTLAILLAKMLPRLYDRVGSADLLCRLCDRAACTGDATCPVGQAERERCR